MTAADLADLALALAFLFAMVVMSLVVRWDDRKERKARAERLAKIRQVKLDRRDW